MDAMFIRVKKLNSGKKTYEYLQICETTREGSKVRQQVVATLGKLDELVPSGQLDRFILSMARFSENLQVINRHRDGEIHS